MQKNERILAAHKKHLEKESPAVGAPREVPILPLSKLNLPPHLQPSIVSNNGPSSMAMFSKPYMPMNLGEPILMHKPYQLSADGSRMKKESFTQKIKRHLSNAGSKVSRSRSFYHGAGFDPAMRSHDLLAQMEARRNKLTLGDMSQSESSLVHASRAPVAHHHQQAVAHQHGGQQGLLVPKKVQAPAVLRQLRAREHQSFRSANSTSSNTQAMSHTPGRLDLGCKLLALLCTLL